MATIPIHLSDTERYAAFRQLDLPNKVKKGWVILEVENRPGPPKYIPGKRRLPDGTIPQKVYYYIKLASGYRWLLVKAHQYKLPDDKIIGGPDPLFIRLDDVILTRTEK